MPNDVTLAVIGGSGLGEALLGRADTDAKPTTHQPGTPFGAPSGPITETRWNGTRVLLLQRHGPGHRYAPADVPYRANLFALKQLGATHVLASGATGSLREDIHPGQIVLPDQIIDKTTKRPATFYDHAAVHVELAEPMCPVMHDWLKTAADQLAARDGIRVATAGTYICMEGPSFSTRAESEMHRQWGGDLIGMTAMPEARLAREAELAYALIALPTDYDCWRPRDDDQADSVGVLQEVIANLKTASQRGLDLIALALDHLAVLQATPSPAHDALKFAIWTDKAAIPDAEVARLAPLWGRYFQA